MSQRNCPKWWHLSKWWHLLSLQLSEELQKLSMVAVPFLPQPTTFVKHHCRNCPRGAAHSDSTSSLPNPSTPNLDLTLGLSLGIRMWQKWCCVSSWAQLQEPVYTLGSLPGHHLNRDKPPGEGDKCGPDTAQSSYLFCGLPHTLLDRASFLFLLLLHCKLRGMKLAVHLH